MPLLPVSLLGVERGRLSRRERNTGRLYSMRWSGGEWGGERESPNVADGFVGNARLRDTSRGTGVGRARCRLAVRNEWGSGHRWRLADSANRALSPGVFYPAIYAETEKTVPHIPPALPADRGISLALGRWVLSVLFARALPVRPSAQERTLSFRDPLRQHAFLSPQDRIEKCLIECSVCATRVSLSCFQKTGETARSLSLVFERLHLSRPQEYTAPYYEPSCALVCASVRVSS